MNSCRNAVEQIRDAKPGVSLFVVTTGAGAGLQDILWNVPGMSSALAGAAFPYAPEQCDDLLGYRPVSYCTAEIAMDYAITAYVRARECVVVESPDCVGGRIPIGLGLTASVASTSVHRGDHRVFACAISPQGAFAIHLSLPKAAGHEARIRDGFICDILGLNLVLETLGIPRWPIRPDWTAQERMALSGRVTWEDGDSFVAKSTDLRPDELRAHLFRRPVFSRSGLRQRIEDLDVANLAFMPASLNPPHEGHRRMADVVERERRRRVVYTVTADSAHKPSLNAPQMLDRAAAVRHQRWEPGGARTVVFTQGDPLFLDKARRWPNAEFVVGADTVLRMLDPKWGPDPERLLHELQGLGTKFLVFGREASIGDMPAVFVPAPMVLRDLPFDASPYAAMFVPMPGRWDVSSTQLRAGVAL